MIGKKIFCQEPPITDRWSVAVIYRIKVVLEHELRNLLCKFLVCQKALLSDTQKFSIIRNGFAPSHQFKTGGKFLTFYFLVVLVIPTVLAGCSKGAGEYDSFAQCLTEKGATMYGTEWCSHCKNQKKAFGNSFQYVDYVDCDLDKAGCVKAGVRGYPTWRIDEENYPGEQSLGRLASLSGCELG